jgi:hypothetical protein
VVLVFSGCAGSGTDGMEIPFGYAIISSSMCTITQQRLVKLTISPPRPGALSGVHGVIATVSSNYGQNNKLVFEGTSKWTLIATAGVAVVCGGFLLFYHCVVSRSVKKHEKDYGKRQTGRHGEGTGFGTKKPSTWLNITW